MARLSQKGGNPPGEAGLILSTPTNQTRHNPRKEVQMDPEAFSPFYRECPHGLIIVTVERICQGDKCFIILIETCQKCGQVVWAQTLHEYPRPDSTEVLASYKGW
jgi:hypothetical protein